MTGNATPKPIVSGYVPADPLHMTAALAAVYLAYIADGQTEGPRRKVITVGLIRSWAHRGYVRRVGTDPSTRQALYDLADITRRARERGLLGERLTAV